MAANDRKGSAPAGSVSSPQDNKKKFKTESMTKDQKIDEMYEAIMGMKTDMAQTRLVAQQATATAEMATEKVTSRKKDVDELKNRDQIIKKDIMNIKDTLKSLSGKSHVSRFEPPYTTGIRKNIQSGLSIWFCRACRSQEIYKTFGRYAQKIVGGWAQCDNNSPYISIQHLAGYDPYAGRQD